MNWDAVGAIAEIIGSLTVVITVGYLAVQIRQSGKAARSASTNLSRAAVTDALGIIIGSTEAVETYTRGMLDPESLEKHERVRFDLIVFQELRAIETIYLENRENMVVDELWEGQWRGMFSILKTAGGRQSWARQKNFVCSSLKEWIDAQFLEFDQPAVDR